jgi:uncharacterized delta-60 repeat protein
MAAVFSVFLLGAQGRALAAPGDIDPSFGASGVVETPQVLRQGHLREFTLGMAIGPHDEIFTLGAVPQACPERCPLDLEVTRYGRDGARDSSFGSGGRAVLTVSPGQDLRIAASIAVGADGKAVVATTDASEIAVFRLTAGGALDPTFGGSGTVKVHLTGHTQAAKVEVQPDRSIVVAGARETALEGTQPLLVKLTPGGALDGSFGQGGVSLLGFALDDYPAGLALTGRGLTAVGLSDCCYATGRALVARLTAGGDLDHSFAGKGWRSVGRLAPVRVDTLMPALKGRLILIGVARKGVFAARFLADGRPDPRFGRGGLVWPKLPLPRRKFSSAAVDGAGRILFASMDRSSGGFALARLRGNGHLDLTFGGGEARGLPGITGNAWVGTQSTGRILVLGEGGACERTCPPSQMVLARYMGGKSGARCDGRRATIVGTRRSETLEGTQHRDVIQALGGNDRIFGLGGNDLICGWGGNDRLVGGKGRDRLLGGPGRNHLQQN